jgi:hypothetical protein
MLLSDAKKQIMQWLQEGVQWRRDMAEQRYTQCLDCPHFRRKIDQCSKCGCYMPAKVWLAWAECPEGKWGKVKEE